MISIDMKGMITQLAGLICAICFNICYIPQIYKIIKTKHVKDVSPTMLYLCLVGYFFGFYYVFMSLSGIYIIINYTLGCVSSTILCILYEKYKDKK
jgi:uncharacterized protein with PQ loop repeat